MCGGVYKQIKYLIWVDINGKGRMESDIGWDIKMQGVVYGERLI